MIVSNEPFPHIVIENALPEQDYWSLEMDFPSEMAMSRSCLKANAEPLTEFPWKAHLAAQLKELFGVEGSPVIGRYMLRKPGYELHPHLDPCNLILTVIHYLPYDDQSEEAGTILYKATKPLLYKSDGAQYFSWRDISCEPIKTVPYRRNTLLAFPNTPLSAHGLAKLTADRRLYQWHLLKEKS